MNLTDTATIKQLAQKYGIKPSALSGQNFLVDKNILARIVAAAAIRPGDNVLEIGPGFGVLTECLLAAGAKVLAVEKDRRLADYLQKRFGRRTNFKLKCGDALKIGNKDITAEFLLTFPKIGSSRYCSYRVISNIPYQITGKILKKFVSDTLPKPIGMTILLQKEVAERLGAGPGKLNMAAIAVQLYSKPRIEFFVEKTAFWPVPKVHSALVCLDKISEKPLYPIRNIKKFWQIVRIGFSSPRKQLHNNLAAGLKLTSDRAAIILGRVGLEVRVRPQELSVEQWVELAMALDPDLASGWVDGEISL